MAVALPALQGYTLEDEPQVPCLCIIYQPNMSSEQFRQAQTLLLELITKKKVQKLFIDTSRMALISPSDRVWVVTDWFTQATKAGLKAIAGLAPRQFLMHLLMVEPLAKIGSSFSIQVRWFTNREEALWWLEGYGKPEKEH
jgi:hypothetical protein